MKVYCIRVEFRGRVSGLIESKEFAFASDTDRETFKNNFGTMTGAFATKALAEWEAEVFQSHAMAETALLRAIHLPVR